MNKKPWWWKLGIREKKDIAAFIAIFITGAITGIFLAIFGIFPFLVPYP